MGAEGYDRKLFGGAHFAIRHFGSTVPYVATQFCDKNIDPLDKEILSLMCGCAGRSASGDFSASLFAQPTSQHRSISFKFRDEMAGLVETLGRCDGHFIRCIKPNDERKPFHLDAAMSHTQLQSCGVLEAAKVSQAGYPKRIPYLDFFNYFMGPHALRRTAARLSDAERQKLAKCLAIKVLRLKYAGTASPRGNGSAGSNDGSPAGPGTICTTGEFELGKTHLATYHC